MSVFPNTPGGVLIVPPTAILTSMLQAGDLPVPTPGVDPEVWSNKAWAKGDLCCVVATRRVYKRIVAGTTNTSPQLDGVNWNDYAAVNADRMFDQVIGTQTVAPGQIVRKIKPGQVITAIALLNVDGVNVDIEMTDPSGEAWVRHYPLVSDEGVTDWFAWHFKAPRRKRQVLCLDVPPYSEATWTITITAEPGGKAGCGVLLMGYGTEIGLGLQFGAGIGRINYSLLDFDSFGNGTYVPHGVARRLKFAFPVSNADVDFVNDYVDGLMAQNCLVVGYAGLACTVGYGLIEDFNVVIPGALESDCDLNFKGMI